MYNAVIHSYDFNIDVVITQERIFGGLWVWSVDSSYFSHSPAV